MKQLFLLMMICLSAVMLNAQELRSLNNDGVGFYEKKQYNDAEILFRKGIEKDSKNYIPSFNLGDTYYRKGEYEKAVTEYQNAINKTADGKEKAAGWYNIGNAQASANKWQDAVNAYKQSLKLNPNDANTKYNLSYALKKLQEEQQQNKNNQNKNDKNKDDKNKDDKKDQNKDNKDDKNKDNKDQDKKDGKNDQNKNDQQNKDKQDKKQQSGQQPKISKQDAEKVLDALKNNEKDLQKKLRKKTGVKVKIEKDW